MLGACWDVSRIFPVMFVPCEAMFVAPLQVEYFPAEVSKMINLLQRGIFWQIKRPIWTNCWSIIVWFLYAYVVDVTQVPHCLSVFLFVSIFVYISTFAISLYPFHFCTLPTHFFSVFPYPLNFICIVFISSLYLMVSPSIATWLTLSVHVSSVDVSLSIMYLCTAVSLSIYEYLCLHVYVSCFSSMALIFDQLCLVLQYRTLLRVVCRGDFGDLVCCLQRCLIRRITSEHVVSQWLHAR
jgi:hypothetical protein